MNKIKQVSSKRQALNSHYTRLKKELEIELKAKGEWFCFFSGLGFPDHYTWKDVTFHHLIGRENDLLTDRDHLVPVLDKYHTGDEGWHNLPLSTLRNLWWFNGFTERLKDKDHDLYMNLKYKLEALK